MLQNSLHECIISSEQPKTLSMDKSTHPRPLASELKSAILILSQTLQSLRLKHAFISHSAIFLHAQAYSLPCLLPSNITILIQPSPALSAHSLIQILQNNEYSSTFLIKHKKGIAYPNVIITRPKEDVRGDLLVGFKILDHWTHPQRREAYDLRLPANSTQSLIFGTSQIQIQTMTPSWLLHQKIRRYNSRNPYQEREKHMDEIDIRTLVDTLEFRGGRKMRFKGREEVDMLKAVVRGMKSDDPGALGGVIECLEVFGPWWRVGWVQGIGVLVGVLVLMRMLDF
ncbi:hypothetical protein VTL71DRAFT_13430 [Oculimacula yallundae]|uniref:Uncharacterized protein n=1 Tax=Oculimacula yallundae TaxID=86028 RepID=A0ABR4CK99_9HELO